MTSYLESEEWLKNSKVHWNTDKNIRHNMSYDWEKFFKDNFRPDEQFSSADLECTLISLRCFIYHLKNGRIKIER